jgi:type I restriction enzyme S subunit
MKTTLNDISDSIGYGVTASACDQPVGPKFLRITDIQNGKVNWEKVPWCEKNGKAIEKAKLRAGDIVFARTGATTGKSYLISDCPNEAVFASYLIRVRLGKMADPGFVSHFFQTEDYWKQITKNARGVAQPGVNATTLKSLQIPLPPLLEQKRIAAILDAADALRAKRRESISQLDTLVQSTFLEMFGDPVTNPKGWEVKMSGDLFQVPPRIGTTKPASKRGFLVVRVGEVGQSRIAFSRCQRVEIEEKDFKKFKLEPGDTVIARAIGSKNQLGKASYFQGFKEPVVIDSHVMRFRPDPLKCDGFWLYSLLASERGKLLLQRAGGATAVQFNINSRQASALQIPNPPLDLQRRFATIVQSIESQKSRLRAHLAELDTLFASLQSRAFNGEL